MPNERWKVVNRNGQKVSSPESGGYQVKLLAESTAQEMNERGFDDGPFTVQPWGAVHGWYGDEGHREAAVERGEEPDA